MDPRKVQILQELAQTTKGKDMKSMAPLLAKATKKMREENLQFTAKESELMMDILTQNMSPQEKQKAEMMKKIMK